MSEFENLLGSTLINARGEKLETSKVLEGKVVCLYFSAHWCPPCRHTTPLLAAAYPKIVAKHPFEVVFVSSDKTAEQHSDYIGGMPWLGLPYDRRDKKTELSAKYGVSGIPSLIILDKDGSIITKDGRSAILDDKEGDEFPWRPETTHQILAKATLEKTDGTAVPFAHLQGKTLGLYFSASWCGPCQSFTPQLIKVYNELKKKEGVNFEIVFLTSDRDTASASAYFAKMPWLWVPFDNKKPGKSLSSMFEVEGIPSLVILSPEGDVISKSAVGNVRAPNAVESFPWYPPAVPDINDDDVGEELNRQKFVVALAENSDDAEQQEVMEILDGILGGKRPEEGETLYGIAKSQGNISSQIRKLCKVDEKIQDVQVIMLDLGNGQYFKAPSAEFGLDMVNKFVDSVANGAIEPTKLR